MTGQGSPGIVDGWTRGGVVSDGCQIAAGFSKTWLGDRVLGRLRIGRVECYAEGVMVGPREAERSYNQGFPFLHVLDALRSRFCQPRSHGGRINGTTLVPCRAVAVRLELVRTRRHDRRLPRTPRLSASRRALLQGISSRARENRVVGVGTGVSESQNLRGSSCPRVRSSVAV